MKTILVTGALGHIGSRLLQEAPRLLPGVRIRILDNLLTQRFCSLFDLPAAGSFDFREGDIFDPVLENALEGVTAVIHLAGITDAAGSAGNRDLVMKVNLEGARRVGEACAARGIPMLLASTTSVYGTQSEVVDENCLESDLKPQSPYAESKLGAERALAELGIASGLRWTACRFGTIFGVSPGMRFHTAVNKFIYQACLGQPITVWRTALDQKRPYLDLSDAVEAIAFFIRQNLFPGRIFNVVTCNATVRQITDRIRDRIPDLTIQFVDTAIMNQLSYEVRSDRILEAGFRFNGDLATSIAATIARLERAGGRFENHA